MPRAPRVWYDHRRKGWVSMAIGPLSLKTGRCLGKINREIGPPVGRNATGNRAAAELWLAKELEQERLEESRETNPTLADAAELFCEWSRGGKQERTIRSHAERLRTFCRFRRGTVKYGDLRLSELGPADLSRFISAKRKEGWAPTYINSVVLSVQALMNWCARPVENRPLELMLAANPFAGVQRPRNPLPPKRYCGYEARRAFLRYAHARACASRPGSHARRFDRLAYELLRFCETTGCRPSEACRLEWSHIRWDEFRAVLQAWHGRRAEHQGKTAEATGRPRVIPLTESLLRVLRAIQRLPGRHPRYVFTHARRDTGGKIGDLAGAPWVANALAHKVRAWRDEAMARAADEAETGKTPRYARRVAGAEWANLGRIESEGEAALTLYAFRRDVGADVLRLGGSYADVAEVLGNSAVVAERHYASYESSHAVNLAHQVEQRRKRTRAGEKPPA